MPPVGSPYFEGPPYNRGPGYPPFHDPYRHGVREADAYSRTAFGQCPPAYLPYYDRPPYDPASMNRSNLDYRDRYGSYDDRYSMHRRGLGAEGDHRPAATRPVVVDYNHGSASGDKTSASKPETSRNSSDRDYRESQQREQRMLEEEKLRSGSYDRDQRSLDRDSRRPADRDYGEEKLRSGIYDREQLSLDRDARRPDGRDYDEERRKSGIYDRERLSLDRDARRPDGRDYDEEKLQSGIYGREQMSLDRDARRLADRDFGDDIVKQDRIERRQEISALDANRHQTAVMAEHVGRAASYERESRQGREQDRSSLEREQLQLTESGRQGSSSMEVDVNFVRKAIVSNQRFMLCYSYPFIVPIHI